MKMQSIGSGRPVFDNLKNELRAAISPWNRGFWVSALVSAITNDRSDFLKIAAPNILFPFATPSRVRGRMLFSMTPRAREQRSSLVYCIN